MKKYSVVKILFAFFLIACAFLYSSCITQNGVSIPGEEQIQIENITAEYFAIAKGYADIKNYTKAIEYYKKAMSSKKLHDSAYFEMARCYAFAKDLPNAEAIYKNLEKKDPDNTNIKISLAYIKAMSGELKEAEEMYRILVEKNPNDQSLLKNYIFVLMADGKYEIAETQYFILKEKFPDEKEIPDILAKLADNLDNTEKLLPQKNNASEASTTEATQTTK